MRMAACPIRGSHCGPISGSACFLFQVSAKYWLVRVSFTTEAPKEVRSPSNSRYFFSWSFNISLTTPLFGGLCNLFIERCSVLCLATVDEDRIISCYRVFKAGIGPKQDQNIGPKHRQGYRNSNKLACQVNLSYWEGSKNQENLLMRLKCESSGNWRGFDLNRGDVSKPLSGCKINLNPTSL
jgi:hypothetical protein